MKSLLILRHADAVAPTNGTDDFKRALSAVGEQQSRAIGERLQGTRVVPDSIACSAALRAQQTANIVREAAHWTAKIAVVEDFYNATCDELVSHVRSRTDDINQLCIVAHAPGVGELVSFLTTQRHDLALVYAAGTLAEVALDVDDWSETGAGCGALRSLTEA